MPFFVYYIKYILCVHHFSLCAPINSCVRAHIRTGAHLRGNIACHHKSITVESWPHKPLMSGSIPDMESSGQLFTKTVVSPCLVIVYLHTLSEAFDLIEYAFHCGL